MSVTRGSGLLRIGELSRRQDVSPDVLRVWERRYGLLRPERTEGGFRLYTETDVARLMVIRRMKPLDFSLEEMRDLLDITDRLAAADDRPDDERERLRERLDSYREVADARCETLRARLEMAEDFAATLRRTMES